MRAIAGRAPGVLPVAGDVTAGPSSGALSSPLSTSAWPEGRPGGACAAPWPLDSACTEPFVGRAGDAAGSGRAAAGCDSPFPSLACC